MEGQSTTKRRVVTRLAVLATLAVFGAVVMPAGVQAQEIESGVESGEDVFVHPFFAHMALADPVGEASLRVTAIQVREGADIHGDFGIHLEAGLVPRLGIHVRTDGIRSEQTSEVMLMYNLFVTRDQRAGLSVFGQLDVPTGPVQENTYRGLAGVGVKETLGGFGVFNGDIHYSPTEKMAEYEASTVFRASDLLYPIVEARGEIRSGEGTSFYLLPALKLRSGNKEIGLGVQAGVSGPTDYDMEALIQFGIEF